MNGTNVRNANVVIYDTNPFLNDGKENNLRLLIRDIPLSAHDSLIIDELEKLKYKVVGTVIYQRLRVDGQLTDCLTGNRIVYIQQPSKPMPRDMSFGIFKAKVFHFGQPASTGSTAVCSRCLRGGHHRSHCTSDVVCRRCKQTGHLQQDCIIETTPTSPSRDHGSGMETPPTPAANPPAQADDSTNPTERQADASVKPRSSHHDYQTRAQAKITQYLKGERDASQRQTGNNASTPESANADTVAHSEGSSEETADRVQSDASSDELSEDDSVEEMSVESPETPKYTAKGSKDNPKKRKLKSQKLPKIR